MWQIVDYSDFEGTDYLDGEYNLKDVSITGSLFGFVGESYYSWQIAELGQLGEDLTEVEIPQDDRGSIVKPMGRGGYWPDWVETEAYAEPDLTWGCVAGQMDNLHDCRQDGEIEFQLSKDAPNYMGFHSKWFKVGFFTINIKIEGVKAKDLPQYADLGITGEEGGFGFGFGCSDFEEDGNCADNPRFSMRDGYEHEYNFGAVELTSYPEIDGYDFAGFTFDSNNSDDDGLTRFKWRDDKSAELTLKYAKDSSSEQEVTPEAPVLVAAEDCGVEGTVKVPEVDGVVYESSQVGTTVTVRASAADGYQLAEGSLDFWEFDVAPRQCPVGPGFVIPEAPVLVAAEDCGVEGTVKVPEVDGVVYESSQVGTTVTVRASAADGYQLAENTITKWTFDITANSCLEEVLPPQSVIVKFDANGGAGDFRALVATDKNGTPTVHIYDHEPVRDGFEFSGWLVASSLRSQTILRAGDDYAPTSSTTLVAQWDPISTEVPDTTAPVGPSTTVDKPNVSPGAAETANVATTGGLAVTGAPMREVGAAVVALGFSGWFLTRRRRNGANAQVDR